MQKFFAHKSSPKNHLEFIKVKNWYETIYPIPSKYEKNYSEAASKNLKIANEKFNELAVKSENDWLQIIVFQSIFFTFTPLLFQKYFHCIPSLHTVITSRKHSFTYKLLRTE